MKNEGARINILVLFFKPDHCKNRSHVVISDVAFSHFICGRIEYHDEKPDKDQDGKCPAPVMLRGDHNSRSDKSCIHAHLLCSLYLQHKHSV